MRLEGSVVNEGISEFAKTKTEVVREGAVEDNKWQGGRMGLLVAALLAGAIPVLISNLTSSKLCTVSLVRFRLARSKYSIKRISRESHRRRRHSLPRPGHDSSSRTLTLSARFATRKSQGKQNASLSRRAQYVRVFAWPFQAGIIGLRWCPTLSLSSPRSHSPRIPPSLSAMYAA